MPYEPEDSLYGKYRVSIELDGKGSKMSVSGLALAIIALALIAALALGSVLVGIDLMPLLMGAIVVIVCIIAGLLLSALGLFRHKRRDMGIRMPVSALAANVIALGAVVAVAVVLVGEYREPTYEEAAQELTEEGLTVYTIGGDRPALLVLPSGYDPQTPLPLVLSLHGYSSHYMFQDSYFGLSPLVNSHNFALILPNGTRDEKGKRFWNATDLCCGATDSKPDDVAYLTGLVEEAAGRVNIDRTFAAGLSNGAFMSYRLACESLPGLTAIVAVGGSSFTDPARCASARPISILHVHGTGDDVIKIEGGSNPDLGEGSHPDARELALRWAERAGCDLSGVENLPNLDIDARADGDETAVTRYSSGCRDNLVVEFWEMESSPHVPRLAPDFGRRILAWLFDSSG